MSDSDRRLKVVFCWHMHQPYYKGPEQSEYYLPWVYLHGIKDYSDMVSHLEQVPGAKAVVNFAPVLLEQIDDYVAQITAWLKHGNLIRDPLLAALAGPGLPIDQASRKALISACLRANEQHLINRFQAFADLVGLGRRVLEQEALIPYLNDQFFIDLLVWYHVAWFGECFRSNDIQLLSMQSKGYGFDNDDRRRLVVMIGEILGKLTQRYGQLAEQGRVELSVTPYAHPIVPLLLDIRSAREAMPDVTLPDLLTYPGGEERSRWHIRKGVEVFQQHFGFRPNGCWPSEGALSESTLRLLEEEGFHWAATGQQVLSNSLMAGNEGQLPDNWVHMPYRVKQGKLNVFFRDDGLSDLIGFTYGDWHSDDAVGDLISHLEVIGKSCEDNPDAVVSIIMDGENAWEYYPHNASYFLHTMYTRLADHPALEMCTFSEVMEGQNNPSPNLDMLVSGSWVYGTFSTWIGDPDKNRAWEMLVDAKRVYDRIIADQEHTAEQRDELQRQLAICEGSDWFWWFGDYNPGETVRDFERLFRRQLAYLYHLMGEPEPDYLSKVFAVGSGTPSLGGTMRKN